MKNFILIGFWLLGFFLSAQGQSHSPLTHADSVRMIQKARLDSLHARSLARKDSLIQVRKAREQKRKETARTKKKHLKENQQVEEFHQTDYGKADSIREARHDSLINARKEAAERKQRELEEKQELLLTQKKKKPDPLTQELTGGFRLNSDGWSFLLNRCFLPEEEEQHVKGVYFDFSEKKHPKETRSQNENFAILYPNEVKPIPYKYGKINNFYQFKLAYGSSRELTGRLDKKSIMIQWVYAGGLSMGVLKPYYLDLLIPEGNVYVRKYEKYSDANKEYFLDLNNRGTILGGGGFERGWGEVQIKPGLLLRSGFDFDYTPTRKSLFRVEIGASAELYPKVIPIMANTKNSAYFLNFYADIQFGRRWE